MRRYASLLCDFWSYAQHRWWWLLTYDPAGDHDLTAPRQHEVPAPPRGSRIPAGVLAQTDPVLRDALEHFQEAFDRRPTVAELAALGHGIEAALRRTDG